MAVNLAQLNELWGDPINAYPPDMVSSIGPVCTDSRSLQQGDFFVPLKGEYFDGHAFLDDAFKLGAQAAVVSSKSEFKVPQGLLHWIVEDTLQAYQQLGLFNRYALDIPVVAITGSVGKTTTRELIRAALSSLGEILSTKGNNNNDVGVPFTLLQGQSEHSAAVVEMGMRGLGEIKRLSCCTEPDIAVITNIGSAHLGRLGSRSQIANAKCEITSCLRSNGVVVIPAGDPLLEQALEQKWKGRVIRVAINSESSLPLPIYDNDDAKTVLPSPDLVGIVDLQNRLLEIEGKTLCLPLEGRHNAINFMIAIAVARELNVSLESLEKLHVDIPSGRNRRLDFGSLTVFDETYNSSPEAVFAALDLLVSQPGRHFAVLGTMLELGDLSVDLHRQVGERVLDLNLDGLVVVANGAEANAMLAAAKGLPRLAVVSKPNKVMDHLHRWLMPGDTLLLKASRDIALEQLIPLLPRL